MFAATTSAFGGDSVGMVVSSSARLNGTEVPAGTALLSPVLLETTERPAIVHLRNGRVLAVDPVSLAHLEIDASGALHLEVDRGAVRFKSVDEAVVTVADLERVVLDPGGLVVTSNLDAHTDDAAPGAGLAADDGMVDLCRLEDWTAERFEHCTAKDEDHKGCAWEHLEVTEGEATQRLGVDSVLAGRKRNDLGLDRDCRPEVLAWWPAKAALAAAVGLGGILLGDDDEDIVSPVEP